MKHLLRFAAAFVLVGAGAAAFGGAATAAPEEPRIGKCHRIYAPAPGGDEPVEIVVCP